MKTTLIRIDAENGKCLKDNSIGRANEQPQPLTEILEIDMEQPALFSIHNPPLIITVNSLQCQLILDRVTANGTHNQKDILSGYKQYEQGLYNLPSEEYWELLHLFEAFSYIGGMLQYLAEERSQLVEAENIFEYLDQYKECSLVLTARNAGEDSSFSDGCGLRMDRLRQRC